MTDYDPKLLSTKMGSLSSHEHTAKRRMEWRRKIRGILNKLRCSDMQGFDCIACGRSQKKGVVLDVVMADHVSYYSRRGIARLLGCLDLIFSRRSCSQ